MTAAMMLVLVAGARAEEPQKVAIQVVGGRPGTHVTIDAGTPSGSSKSTSLVMGEATDTGLDLGGGETWTVNATAQGFWSAPVQVPPGTATFQLHLWPATELTFELEMKPRGLPVPSELDLRLAPPSSGRRLPGQPPETSITCPVDREGVGHCSAPEGTWDIRAKATGFVPHFFWDRVCERGETVALGRFVLEPGSSVFGRLVTETGPADPRQAEVVLVPDVLRSVGAVGPPGDLARLGPAEGINEWGYFHSDALAPGAYVITARQPGFEDATQAITVRADGDTELSEPIVLPLPLKLTIAVDPPADPAGKPWSIALMGFRQGELETIARGRTDVAGGWVSPPAAPGPYTVHVSNRQGHSFAWAHADLSRDSRELLVPLTLVQVKGEVRIGEDPLSATLWFGGRHGEVRIEAEADADGEFTVVLPRAGIWKVNVQGEGRAVEGRPLVDVDEPEGAQPVEVTITLPDTVIHGSVVDTMGSPVEGAAVELVGLDDPKGTANTVSDAHGAFEVQGQPPGVYLVQATQSTRSSEPVQIAVAERMVPPELELVLSEQRQLRGTVVSQSGPVPGAWVLAAAFTVNGTLAASAAQAQTAMDGTFSLEVPLGAVRARLVVAALGHPLAVSTVEVAADGPVPITVTLAREQGRVEIVSPSNERSSAASTMPLLLLDGEALDFALVQHWARENGARPDEEGAVRVDAMPPGSYAFCELAPAEALLVFSGAAVPAPGSCSEGHLIPGGTLTLTRGKG